MPPSRNIRTTGLVRSVHASLLADMGKTDQALAETRKLLDGKNDREVYLSLAQIYDKAKNFAEMGKMLDSAEKLSKSNEDKESVLFSRGAMYERMKNYPAAEAEFRKVLAINPDNALSAELPGLHAGGPWHPAGGSAGIYQQSFGNGAQ